MKYSKINLALSVAMGGLLVALGWVIAASMRDHVVDVGDTAPDFTITTDSGAKITSASFGGKVLVLNFWATWCDGCVEEVPSLDRFQKEMAPSGVVVLGVSIDRNPKLYDRFLRRFPVAFQTARDPDANISSSYGTYKLPETYIIDRSGKVVQKVIGARNWDDPELMSFIKSI